MDITNATREFGKKALNSLRSLYSGYDAKRDAMDVVRAIEKHNSKKLTPELIKTADEYAIDVLGSKKYAPWLYVYALVRGKFQEGWIPDNFYGNLVLPAINKGLLAVTSVKTFSNVALRTNALPDVAYYIDGIFYNREFSVANIHDLREKLSTTNREVFVKKDRSLRGHGVLRLRIEDLTEDNLQRMGNCVIQSSIRQHAFFEEIISGSVATVRIITAKDAGGGIDARATYIRLGRKDTPWVQADDSVRVPIVNRNGDLAAFGYTHDWRCVLSHPDSGVYFQRRRVPKIRNAVDLCTGLHGKVPHFGIIGWDVAVNENEKIEVMEWNANCGIAFAEAALGPCFLGLGWEKYGNNAPWKK